MPISPIVLQRRHAELGRIRLGAKRGGNGAPMKLEQFRFTTHSERYARDLAELYGGTAQAWDNAGVASWEVYSTATSIPVIAVKGGLSQWMETWSGGGCAHRCDGERTADGEMCDPKDRNHINAKPTTRLSVMLPELEAIGVWRMESHGWNAAAEIPAVAELAQYVGDLVPANLHLVERRSIKDGKTSRFVVPVLDLQIGTARLREIVAAVSNGGELAAPATSSARAIEAGPTENPYAEWATEVQQATDLDTLGAIWTEMRDGHELVGPDSTPSAQRDAFVQAFKVRAAALKPAAVAEPAAEQPPVDEDGAVDAVLVEDPPPAADGDADAIWATILRTASEMHGWSLPQLSDDFVRAIGIIPDEASAAELQSYLHTLSTGEEPAA